PTGIDNLRSHKSRMRRHVVGHLNEFSAAYHRVLNHKGLMLLTIHARKYNRSIYAISSDRANTEICTTLAAQNFFFIYRKQLLLGEHQEIYIVLFPIMKGDPNVLN